MHPVINHVLQLQQLSLIRDEQKVAAKGKHLQDLDASIKSMTTKLPKDFRPEYEKLHKRDPIVASAVSDGHCAVCGMQLAISFIQAIRMEKEILCCPNCARILYDPPTRARRMGQTRRRTAPTKVGISRFSSQSLMIPKMKAKDKNGAIKELAMQMAEAGFVDNGKHLTEEALKREAILSTAVEHGMAFPHVRDVEGGGLALALGTTSGIDFGGSAKGKTHIIFFMSIPVAASAFYLKLLAGLTETFMKADARQLIRAAKDPQTLWKSLTKVTRTTIK